MSVLVTKEYSQVKMTTLAALCTALECCTPMDLTEVDTTPSSGRSHPHPVADLSKAGSARCQSMPPL
ncbi:helix-turn-helix domain-containing protein [Streptomyces sp. NPDC004685]